MRYIVCIKQVPNTTEIKIDPVTNTLVREGVESILNPFDAYAVEEAVRLKEAKEECNRRSVWAKPVESTQRKGVLGVMDHSASDRKFAGPDTRATTTLGGGDQALGRVYFDPYRSAGD